MNDLLVVIPGMFARVDLQQLLQVLRRPGQVPLLHLHSHARTVNILPRRIGGKRFKFKLKVAKGVFYA